MIMIGGNSRNAGKTTLACKIIVHLSAHHDVIAIKVTSIRPGETDFHGNHDEDIFSGFTITEETQIDTHKDTSLMLKSGAKKVFYIRASDDFMAEAMAQFLSQYNHNQPIICESRSLRKIIEPGLFLMMMSTPVEGNEKNVSVYLAQADKIFTFGKHLEELDQFTTNLKFENGKFI